MEEGSAACPYEMIPKFLQNWLAREAVPSATVRKVVWLRRLFLGLLSSKTYFWSCSLENKQAGLGNCYWAMPEHWNAESSCPSTLDILNLEIGHWNAVWNNLYLSSHAGEKSLKQQDGFPSLCLLYPLHPPNVSSWWNLNSFQNHNCQWIGKIAFFVLIFLASVVEESTLGGWGNGIWRLISHIPQTDFSASLWFSNYLFFYFHYSLFTNLSSSHYLMTKISSFFEAHLCLSNPSCFISF